MGGKIYTYDQMIKDLGEIPYCQCIDMNGNNCGMKVIIKPNKFGSYRYYKNCGYPRFIYGHNNKGKNSPTYGKIFSQKEKDTRSESMKKYYQNNPEACQKNSEAILKYYRDNPDKIIKGEDHWSTGRSPWNNGLTKENNEILKKQSENLKGKPLLQETKNKMKEAKIGFVPWNKNLVGVMPKAWNKSEFPPIFDICWCIDKCNEIVWGGRKYINGHQHRRIHRKTGGITHPMFGKSPRHYRKNFKHSTPFQGSLDMFRWEHLLAEYYDSNNILYYYENKYFELILNDKPTTYTPDFYLPNTDEYIEVKGYWRDDSKPKFDRFKETYPEIKIHVIMKEDLISLGISLKNK